MTLITAVSNFITIPLVIKCFKLDLVFVGIIGAMSLISSFLYHFGEIYNCVIFLDFDHESCDFSLKLNECKCQMTSNDRA